MFWIARTMALLIVASCAPAGESPDSVPRPAAAPAGVTGIVRVVGSAPVNVQVILTPAEGGSIRLVGPLQDELANLTGAEVAVSGTLAPSPDPLADRQIEATSYEIVAVDGEPVVMGEVLSVDGRQARLRTPDGAEVLLEVPAGVFEVGQKVWVQGPTAVTVQSFGVLRP